MIKFTITSTKGGVGKTTLTANLGALLADMGLRVLLIDADVQPSLSKFFPLATPHPAAGLTEVIVRGQVTTQCITPTVFPNLHIVVSDDPEGHLPNWLLNRIDRGFRLRFALQSPAVNGRYDCVLIDTQGAIGPLQAWQAARSTTPRMTGSSPSMNGSRWSLAPWTTSSSLRTFRHLSCHWGRVRFPWPANTAGRDHGRPRWDCSATRWCQTGSHSLN